MGPPVCLLFANQEVVWKWFPVGLALCEPQEEKLYYVGRSNGEEYCAQMKKTF